MSSRVSVLATRRGTQLRDIRIDRHLLGPITVRGTLWPDGSAFAATLWAISGRPGGAAGKPIEQVIYTDRGHYRTGMDVYEMAREGIFDGVLVSS